MKKLFPFLLLVSLIISACNKYRIVHIGCKDGALAGGTGNESVYLPNLFTPNGDGDNDVLKVYYPRDSTSLLDFEIVIKNTLGTKVFDSHDPNFEWDGTHNGKPCKDDVYNVSLNFRFFPTQFNGSIHTEKGLHVTLYRNDMNVCLKYGSNCVTGGNWNGGQYNPTLPNNEFLHGNCN